MYLAEAKRKYKDEIDAEILNQYQEPDKFVYINTGDQDLQPFRVQMPIPPDWSLIEGFGLPAREQKFKYEVYPEKLKRLEEDIRLEVYRNKKDSESKDSTERIIYEKKWETLDINREEYKEELDWIRLQWWHRLNGKWYFIKGKPTYLCGLNFFCMNYYNMEGGTDFNGLPEYRWRDMKWWHAFNYICTTHESVYFDEEGKTELLEDGTLRMIDTGSRTALGMLVNKGRRMGDSSKAASSEIYHSTSELEFVTGMQADNEENALGLYTKLSLYSFNKLPFFFMPITPNSKRTKKISMVDVTGTEGLNSSITVRASGEKAYDGARLNFYKCDEPGKTENVSVKKRHGIVARTLMPGVRIKGSMIYTSTVEELKSEAGKEFEDMAFDSMFEKRGINNRTTTSLITVYFSATESYEGFIDPWGYPILESPTDPEVIENMAFIKRNEKGEVMGVVEYLDKLEQEFLERDDLKGLSEHQRKNPTSFRACFANASFNLMFDRVKLQGRLTEIKYSKNNPCVKGDFIEVNDRVLFIPKEDGPFNVSMRLAEGVTNRRMFNGATGTYRPETGFDTQFIISADPYKVSRTDSRRQSKGSIVVLYKHDPVIDNPNKDFKEWRTKKFIVTYLKREKNLDAYCEKVLLCARYFNAPVYPENNLSVIQEYFERKRYDGYLLKDVDSRTGKLKENAGWTTGGSGGAKEELFSLVADYIDVFCHNIDHKEIIEEVMAIPSPERMKDFDLFVGLGGALKGERSSHLDRMRRFNTTKCDISGFYRTR